eukprot:TRINITY_DN1118_c0_g2_i2.p1 TRINITY_DN1118_c0_g2~~TRINITY_DN1118_c0_g2_i2.p1  ORF type:complete len:496 (+),score=110.55 TRINITY_DN1118_c0_g2_i2:48-1535(+)
MASTRNGRRGDGCSPLKGRTETATCTWLFPRALSSICREESIVADRIKAGVDQNDKSAEMTINTNYISEAPTPAGFVSENATYAAAGAATTATPLSKGDPVVHSTFLNFLSHIQRRREAGSPWISASSGGKVPNPSWFSSFMPFPAALCYCEAIAADEEEYQPPSPAPFRRFSFPFPVAYARTASPNQPLSSGLPRDGHMPQKMEKLYVYKLKPLLMAFQPKHLLLTTLRCFVSSALLTLEQHLPKVPFGDDDEELARGQQEEERDNGGMDVRARAQRLLMEVEAKKQKVEEEEERRREELMEVVTMTYNSVCREVAGSTVRRFLERQLVKWLTPRWAWKLTKDYISSSRRKVQRGFQGLGLAFCVTRTTFRANILGVLASWVVQLSIDSVQLMNSLIKIVACLPPPPPPGSSSSSSRSSAMDDMKVKAKREVQWFARRAVRQAVRITSVHAVASMGAGLCCIVLGGNQGPWIGFCIGEYWGSIFVCPLVDKILP